MKKVLRSLPEKQSLPYALYRAQQVMALDKTAMAQGIAGAVLMERAGTAAFALLRERWPEAQHITVLVGTGNNGGDGFVLARLALAAGLQVLVLQLGGRARIKGDALLNANEFQQADGDWQLFAKLPQRTDVLVDSIFGTGLEGEVTGIWATAIAAINQHQAPVLAIDIPSGLNADSGNQLGIAVRADACISFIGLKQGMFTGYGPACCGDISFAGLAVPATVYKTQLLSARRIDWAKLSQLLSPRARLAHKGDFGHVLVIGGDQGFAGAARLSAEAALRTGAGLVSLATHPQNVTAVLAVRPEIMANGVENPESLKPLLKRCSVIAIGPGLGQSAWGRSLWEAVHELDKPMIVDADALNFLAEQPQAKAHWVLTPHPGEASRLLNQTTTEIMTDRYAAVAQIQKTYQGVAVLKGAGSLVAAAGNRPVSVCSDGNPGMASGGMGDVLTGIIAGFVAQGFSLQESAEMGVCLHAAAADEVASIQGERGMLASDLLLQLAKLVNPC